MVDPATAGMMVSAGGQLLGGLFGRKKKGTGVPQQQVSKTGYEALPAWMQDYIKQQQQLAQQAIHGTKEQPVPQLKAAYQQYQGNPESPFYNPELAALQQSQGELPVQQIGVQAQLNPYQQAAMQQLGRPDYSAEGLAQYMQPTNAQRQAMEQILNRQYDIQKGNLADQQARLGSRVRPGTEQRLIAQQNAIERNRQEGLAGIAGQLERQGQQDALALRREALSGQMNIGDFLHQYQQQQLNNATGYNRTANNPVYGQTQAMQQLWNPYLGAQSNVQTGAIPAQLNNIGRIGGALMALGNQNFGGQQNKQWNW